MQAENSILSVLAYPAPEEGIPPVYLMHAPCIHRGTCHSQCTLIILQAMYERVLRNVYGVVHTNDTLIAGGSQNGTFLFGSKGSKEEEKDERAGDWPFPQAPSSCYIPAVSHHLPSTKLRERREREREIWFHPGVKEPSHHTR
ncbi:hypothetical protein TEQG_01153 [Trichophyton equinum CBS 127.97]|uniref:Uncharacterized protein n=1 Tax=Trichophyton equinum (strain ATCC MYA-4606 / CBS 127.97) TaxID=559882 RepID=F2PJP6_TRIEC|nr:hypothetical protein TEQG_01153 [Trichophyton equinum CBS 127.97]